MESSPDSAELRSVTLAGATDLAGFRRACRDLWAARCAPERVSWHTADSASGDLFESTSTAPAAAGDAAPVSVPPRFMTLCESVVLHCDPGRFGLLYRLLWRLQHDRRLRDDPLDPDWISGQQMAQAVRRDLHKMKAFVRFRTVDGHDDSRSGGGERAGIGGDVDIGVAEVDPEADSKVEAVGADIMNATTVASEPRAEPSSSAPGSLHVAWFEPEHHIVEAVAPFFVRRFANMRWAILTPERCIAWDGGQLRVEPGVDRSQAPPADAGEALWLTYYQNIFNPARLKVAMMQREMPKRYWPNLPEAALIDPLIAEAAERSMTMIDREPTEVARRRPVHTLTAAVTSAPTPGGGPASTSDGSPSTLSALGAATDRCRECPIGQHATQSVPGEGPANARLMFVGEQPGDQEDLQGRPFVGPAGKLFSRAMAELGWSRDKVYVTNAVKHFKFELRGKRRIHKTPAQQEAAACLHWLESEIGLVQPEALVALGATAARQLMQAPIAVTRQRGQWLTRSDGRQVLITLHPSALLRMEPADQDSAYAAWLADLRQLTRFFTSDVSETS